MKSFKKKNYVNGSTLNVCVFLELCTSLSVSQTQHCSPSQEIWEEDIIALSFSLFIVRFEGLLCIKTTVPSEETMLGLLKRDQKFFFCLFLEVLEEMFTFPGRAFCWRDERYKTWWGVWLSQTCLSLHCLTICSLFYVELSSFCTFMC